MAKQQVRGHENVLRRPKLGGKLPRRRACGGAYFLRVPVSLARPILRA